MVVGPASCHRHKRKAPFVDQAAQGVPGLPRRLFRAPLLHAHSAVRGARERRWSPTAVVALASAQSSPFQLLPSSAQDIGRRDSAKTVQR